MKVLVGCEFSATVRRAFATRGHDAWSCDVLPSDHKGKHIQSDIIAAIKSRKWDCLILHPPCTGMGLCGNRTYGKGKPKHAMRIAALDWTESLWRLAISVCGKVAMEQPRSVLCQRIGTRTQEIQPWQFGHMEQKATWLWLHGLPKLQPTNNVHAPMMRLPKRERERESSLCRRGRIAATSVVGLTRALPKRWLSSGAACD